MEGWSNLHLYLYRINLKRRCYAMQMIDDCKKGELGNLFYY